eukprot:746912-Hanusia_phi.AAC.5
MIAFALSMSSVSQQSLGKLAAFFSCEVAGGGDVDFCVERGRSASSVSEWLMEGLAKPSSGFITVSGEVRKE